MPFVGRRVASEHMEMPIIGAHFEERIIRAIPLAQYFLNHVSLPPVGSRTVADRLSVRVALHT